MMDLATQLQAIDIPHDLLWQEGFYIPTLNAKLFGNEYRSHIISSIEANYDKEEIS